MGAAVDVGSSRAGSRGGPERVAERSASWHSSEQYKGIGPWSMTVRFFNWTGGGGCCCLTVPLCLNLPVPFTKPCFCLMGFLGEGGGGGGNCWIGTVIVKRFGWICLSQAGHQALSNSMGGMELKWGREAVEVVLLNKTPTNSGPQSRSQINRAFTFPLSSTSYRSPALSHFSKPCFSAASLFYTTPIFSLATFTPTRLHPYFSPLSLRPWLFLVFILGIIRFI